MPAARPPPRGKVRFLRAKGRGCATLAQLRCRFKNKLPIRWPTTLCRETVSASGEQLHLEEIGPRAPPIRHSYVESGGMISRDNQLGRKIFPPARTGARSGLHRAKTEHYEIISRPLQSTRSVKSLAIILSFRTRGPRRLCKPNVTEPSITRE